MLTNKSLKTIPLLFLIAFLLSACLPSKIQDKIDETEEKNSEIKKNSKDENEEVTLDNVKLSKEQLEILDKLEKEDAKEVVYENDLDKKKEISINVPDNRSSFESPEEFSQYLGNLFFAYHTGEIKPEDFVNQILPHAHPSFIEMLPKDKENQIATFMLLQNLYIDQLRSPIESYVITDLQFQERVGEAIFYRKYNQKNGEVIYSITVIKKEGNSWKLLDDSPAPPYEVEPLIENQNKKKK